MSVSSSRVNTSVSTFPIGKHTNHILIIDDNAQLRAMLARHLMLTCRENGLSCALFHITEKSQARLTFFEQGGDASAFSPELTFAIYESSSPRQALNWLQINPLRRLAIISDVMMPVDTEVGLEGLLDGLAELEMAVGLLFVSSEDQSRRLVQQLMSPQASYFLLKGSEDWSRLPETLIRNIEKLPYQLIRRPIQARKASPSVNNDTYLVRSKTTNNVLEVKMASPMTALGAGSGGRGWPQKTLTPPKRNWWSRLLYFFSN